jgi:hypothetical protein
MMSAYKESSVWRDSREDYCILKQACLSPYVAVRGVVIQVEFLAGALREERLVKMQVLGGLAKNASVR